MDGKQNMKKLIALLLLVPAFAAQAQNTATTGAGWKEASKTVGVRDGQFVAAPSCVAGGVPVANVKPEKAHELPVSVGVNYALSKVEGGWRVSITGTDTLVPAPETKKLTVTVAAYCAL